MKLDSEQMKICVILAPLGFSLVLFVDVARAQTIGARFRKVVPPLHTDLENAFILARWTQSPMYCALECIQTDGCQSFLYTNEACYDGNSHHEYIGTHSTTFTGKTCQAWSSQTPHTHSYTDYFPDGSVTRARNYCRDPDNSGYLWCFTTDPDERWEPCDIPSCSYEYSDGFCQETYSSTDYTGQVRNSLSGRTCQSWASQSPHGHNYAGDSYYEGGVHAAENFCRDHIGNPYGMLWCYTRDAGMRWEGCGVKHCSDVLPLERCYSTTSHKEYTGTWKMTITGALCQRWDSQTPHAHSDNGDNLFPDATLADAANYCRDPDDKGFLWCYTTDENIRWQPCGIPRCKNHIPCRTAPLSADHSGDWSRTYTGKTCQRWDFQSPHAHPYSIQDHFNSVINIHSASNYCMDPNGSGKLWCYTTAANTEWEYCDIALCRPERGNCMLYNTIAASADPPSIRDGFSYYRKLP